MKYIIYEIFPINMMRLLNKISFWFDYYIVYFLYSGMKRNMYREYMIKKWGHLKK